METLDYLKAKTGETNEDKLNACILDAEEMIKAYCNIVLIPTDLEIMTRKLALRSYNKLGIESSTSYSEGGISTSLVEDITPEDRSILNRFRVFTVGEYVASTTT